MTRLDSLTLRQLRALVAVTETGSLTAAAERLSLSPPAVHAQIRSLEAALDIPLLTRAHNASGSIPTEEAGPVLEAARRIEIALERCQAQILARKAGHVGRVVLGVVSTAKYFAPRLVARLKVQLPDIEVVLREANREGIIAGLERQEIELAIMGRPPRVPSVNATVLAPHPHGFIAPADHPLNGRRVGLSDLAKYPLLSREEGSGTRALMIRYLETNSDGREFDITVMGSNETIKQAVMAGLGLAFLSLHTCQDELRQGRILQLNAPGLPVIRQWFLVYGEGEVLSPAAARLHRLICESNLTELAEGPLPPPSLAV